MKCRSYVRAEFGTNSAIIHCDGSGIAAAFLPSRPKTLQRARVYKRPKAPLSPPKLPGRLGFLAAACFSNINDHLTQQTTSLCARNDILRFIARQVFVQTYLCKIDNPLL